jgi:hypothetical protein
VEIAWRKAAKSVWVAQAFLDRDGDGDGLKGVAKRASYLARALLYAGLAAFLVRAAWQYDPQDAVGLDGALARVAQATYGEWLLAVVAGGLLAYGLFCFMQARFREV